MTYYFRDFRIPDYMQGVLDDYISNGTPVTGFLLAVLHNDLRGACEQADIHNLANLPAYAAYLYNCAPSGCWGSRDAVASWRGKGGR